MEGQGPDRWQHPSGITDSSTEQRLEGDGSTLAPLEAQRSDARCELAAWQRAVQQSASGRATAPHHLGGSVVAALRENASSNFRTSVRGPRRVVANRATRWR